MLHGMTSAFGPASSIARQLLGDPRLQGCLSGWAATAAERLVEVGFVRGDFQPGRVVDHPNAPSLRFECVMSDPSTGLEMNLSLTMTVPAEVGDFGASHVELVLEQRTPGGGPGLLVSSAQLAATVADASLAAQGDSRAAWLAHVASTWADHADWATQALSAFVELAQLEVSR